MITRTDMPWGAVARSYATHLAWMTAFAASVVLAYRAGLREISVPLAIPTLLGTALSILLGFSTNAAYARWWEARKLWGAIINDSRSLARQVLGLFDTDAKGPDPAAPTELQRELVHRQIAWCWALNRALRGQDPLPAVRGLVPDAELAALEPRSNRHAALLVTQAERLRDAHRAGHLELFALLSLDETLSRFSNHMGACERIKKTVFPTPFGAYIRLALNLFLVLLPFGLVEHVGWIAVPITVVVVTIFVLLERTARALQDPFEGRSTDTPMDACCRTIEIDLRQQLGETDVPPPLLPVDGVLM